MARFQTSYEFNTLAGFKSAIVNTSHELYKHLALTEVDSNYPENFTGNSAICYIKELNTTINCGTNVISDIKTGRPGDVVIYDTNLNQYFCIFDRFYDDESYTYKTTYPTVKIYKYIAGKLNEKYVYCGRILKVKGNKITIFKSKYKGGSGNSALKISMPSNLNFSSDINRKNVQGYNFTLYNQNLFTSFKNYLLFSSGYKTTETDFNNALSNTIDNKGIFNLKVYTGTGSSSCKYINLDTNYTFNQNYKSFITHYFTPKYPDNIGLFSKNYVNGKGMTKKLLDEILFKETTVYKDSAGTIIPTTDVTQVEEKYYKTSDITDGIVNEGATELEVITETIIDTSDTQNIFIKTYLESIPSVPNLGTGNWYLGSVYEYLDFPDLNKKYNLFSLASSYSAYLFTSNCGKTSSSIRMNYITIYSNSNNNYASISTSNYSPSYSLDDDYHIIPLADIYV